MTKFAFPHLVIEITLKNGRRKQQFLTFHNKLLPWIARCNLVPRAFSSTIFKMAAVREKALNNMALEKARHPGRKRTGHERSRGWYLVSAQLVTGRHSNA